MRHRHWVLAISISALAVGAAKQASAEPREKQQSLQKLARDIIQSSQVDPEQEQDFKHDSEPSWDWRIHKSSSGASFYVPQIQQRRDGLWYDLGWFKIDELYFDFDHPLGADSPAGAASGCSGCHGIGQNYRATVRTAVKRDRTIEFFRCWWCCRSVAGR